MATWYGQGDVGVNTASALNDASDGSGNYGFPDSGGGDTIDANGHAMTIDCDLPSCTITGSGSFTLDGNHYLNNITIDSVTVYTGKNVATLTSGNTLTINGTLQVSDQGRFEALGGTLTGTGTLQVQWGGHCYVTGQCSVSNDLTISNGGYFMSGWTTTPSGYTNTGNGVGATSAESSRNTDPGEANVWNNITYKILGSNKTGTLRASDITNCEATNVRSGVTIDDVTGTYEGDGGTSATAEDIAAACWNFNANGMTAQSRLEALETIVSDVVDALGANGNNTLPAIRTKLDSLPTTAPLSAADTRAALGLASANLDTQLTSISGYVDCLPATWVTVPTAADISTQVAADLATAHGSGSWATATGFSTLTAADVRSALGMASANLDTQLSGISGYVDCLPSAWVTVPTASQVSAQVAADLATAHGAGAWSTATGFSTLTSADVRSALGIASANLDTQLAAILGYVDVLPGTWDVSISASDIRAALGMSAANLDDQLDALSAMSGEGAYTGTLTVNDGSTGLEGAVVNATRGGVLIASGTTDANGQITDWVFDAHTYTLAVRLPGYQPAMGTLTVTGNSWTKTISLAALSITAPSSPTLCTVQFRVKLSDTAVVGAVCKAKLIGTNQAADGTILSNEELTDTTDAQGVAELELVQKHSIVKGNGIYKLWVEIDGKPVASVQTTIPHQATILFEDLLS